MNITHTYAQAYDSFFKEVEKYRRSIKFDNNFNDIETSTFDIKKYLSIYDNIHIQKGYSLDYIYYNESNGRPYIYAKIDSFELEKYIRTESFKIISVDTIYKTEIKLVYKSDGKFQQVYEKSKDFEIRFDPTSFDEAYHHKLYKFLTDSTNRGYKHLVPNDNELGYFQYLYFKEYGEQFCGKWHQPNAKDLIYDKKEIPKLISSYLTELYSFNKRELKKLKQLNDIDPKPKIIMTESFCEITLFEEESSGIFRRTYKIARTYPYKIETENVTRMVAICPNFIY
ncbi:MAG: hypothetical protein PHR83_00155 [Paludibacter sp.]|nr:hypothetical protein [Paludibacter sp.]